MNEDYDNWLKESPDRQEQLYGKLQECGTHAQTDYGTAALAFPSHKGHSSTFEYPQIGQAAMRRWAELKGYHVQMLPADPSQEDKLSPPVLFTRL